LKTIAVEIDEQNRVVSIWSGLNLNETADVRVEAERQCRRVDGVAEAFAPEPDCRDWFSPEPQSQPLPPTTSLSTNQVTAEMSTAACRWNWAMAVSALLARLVAGNSTTSTSMSSTSTAINLADVIREEDCLFYLQLTHAQESYSQDDCDGHHTYVWLV
jgi:hypothetical protein